jgi:hypothetical protein
LETSKIEVFSFIIELYKNVNLFFSQSSHTHTHTHTHTFLMFWVVLIIRRRSRRDLHKVSLHRPIFIFIFFCHKILHLHNNREHISMLQVSFVYSKKFTIFTGKNCLNSPYLYQVTSSNNNKKNIRDFVTLSSIWFQWPTSLVWPMWLLQVWSVSSPLNSFLLPKPASFFI